MKKRNSASTSHFTLLKTPSDSVRALLLGAALTVCGSAFASEQSIPQVEPGRVLHVGGSRTVTVRPGESLSKIAQREIGSPVYPKGGSLEKLMALNGLTGHARPPHRAPICPTHLEGEYEVHEGDQLSQIAECLYDHPIYGKHGGLARLIALNPDLLRNARLASGSKIRLAPDARRAVVADVPRKAPVRKPASLEEKPKASVEEIGAISLEMNGNFESMTAHDRTTGAQAIIGSKFGYGAALGFSQNWEDGIRTAYYLGVKKTNWESPLNRSLSTSSTTSGKMGFELSKALGHWDFTATGAMEQLPFVNAASASQIGISQATQTSAGLRVKKELFHGKHGGAFAAIVGYEHLFSSQTDSFSVNSGSRLNLGVESKMRWGNFDVFSGLRYDSRSQDSSLIRQKDNQSILYFRFSRKIESQGD